MRDPTDRDEPRPDWTLERWLNHWLEAIIWPRRSDATWKNYDVASRRHIVPRIGGVPLTDLTAEHVQHVVDQLYNDEGLAPKTVRLQWSALNSAMDAALRRGLIEYNPCSGVKLPRDLARVSFVDPERVPEFLTVIQAGDWYWGGMFIMAVTTGMRHGELAGLRWPNVDLRRRQVHVVEQIARRGARPSWKPPKSAAGVRSLSLPGVAIEALEEQQTLNRVRRSRAGTRGWTEHDLVFPSRRGTPAVPNRVNMELAEVCKVAGLRPVRLHHLRHTFASSLLADGVPPAQLAKLLGHERSSTTVDLYGHLTAGMAESAASLFDRMTGRGEE